MSDHYNDGIFLVRRLINGRLCTFPIDARLLHEFVWPSMNLAAEHTIPFLFHTRVYFP